MDSKRSVSLGARLCISSAVILALMALMAPPAGASSADRSRLKNFQHVFILMMENTGYDSLIGNPNAPWINFAASTYGLAKT